MVVDAEQEAEHHGGDDQLHELPTEHLSDGLPGPLNIFLVCHETADEEEQNQVEIHKDMMERMAAVCMVAVTPDMGIYHEVHAETAQGIDIFYSLVHGCVNNMGFKYFAIKLE